MIFVMSRQNYAIKQIHLNQFEVKVAILQLFTRDIPMYLTCKQYFLIDNVIQDYNDMRNRLAQFYVSNGCC